MNSHYFSKPASTGIAAYCASRTAILAGLLLLTISSPSFAGSNHVLVPMTLQNAEDIGLVQTLTDHTNGVWTVVFSPDGQLLASCGQDGQVLVRKVDSLAYPRQMGGFAGWVVGLAFSPDGHFLAHGGADGFSGSSGPINLWNVEADSLERTLLGHDGGCWSLDFQESTGLLVSGSFDRTVRIWNPQTGEEIRTLVGHTAQVLSVDFNPHQNLVASSGIDYTVRIWNSESGDPVSGLRGHTGNIGYVKFSPDGLTVASSADDGTVRLWNVADSSLIWSQPAGQGWVNCVNFNHDGTLMLTCGHDGSVAVRNTANGALIKRLSGHTAPVLRGAFNPDGTLLATASWDRTVRLWGIEQDTDTDGIPDDTDNCVDVPNPDQSDIDQDGIGDACDSCTDNDHDGFGNPEIGTNQCTPDNCPLVSNPAQTDANHDGIGDACCCEEVRGNVNYTGIVDLADLSALVSYLTGGGYQLPDCFS